MENRDDFLKLDDSALSACCELEFFKGSGNGGQKWNKTSSAVRVRLNAFDLSASDCTERPAPQPRQCAREAAPLARADGPGNSGGAAGAHGVRAEPSRLPALSRAPARRGGGTGLGAEAGRRAARRDADRAGQALRPRSGAVDSRERGAGRRRAARAAAAVTNLPNTVQRVSK